MTISQALQRIRTEPSTHQQMAHAEGNNIMTWIGFKHIMYLAEEAVLAHFREAGLGIRHLFEEHGLLLDIVANDGRILHALKLDESVTTTVKPRAPDAAGVLRFDIAMNVERDGKSVKTYSGNVGLVLKRDRSLAMAAHDGDLGELAVLVAEKAVDPRAAPEAPGAGAPAASGAAPQLVWDFTIPYFYCHGNERIKMSGYLRLMEEADARFCAERGIDVCDLLLAKRWIPAVPSASVRIVAEAYMNERLRLVYEVADVIKSLLYKCTMHAYVERDGKQILVARGEIVHAYAEIHSRKDWGMVNFDAQVMTAIGAEMA